MEYWVVSIATPSSHPRWQWCPQSLYGSGHDKCHCQQTCLVCAVSAVEASSLTECSNQQAIQRRALLTPVKKSSHTSSIGAGTTQVAWTDRRHTSVCEVAKQLYRVQGCKKLLCTLVVFNEVHFVQKCFPLLGGRCFCKCAQTTSIHTRGRLVSTDMQVAAPI